MDIKKGLCKCIDNMREKEGFVKGEYYYYELWEDDSLFVCNNKGKILVSNSEGMLHLFKLDVKAGE